MEGIREIIRKTFNPEGQEKFEEKIRIKDKRQGRFVGDNIIFNGYGKYLGAYGIAIYFCLCRFTNNETQSCYPSLTLLANETGISKRQVQRALEKLEKYKLIKRERSKGGRNKRTTYILLEPLGAKK